MYLVDPYDPPTVQFFLNGTYANPVELRFFGFYGT